MAKGNRSRSSSTPATIHFAALFRSGGLGPAGHQVGHRQRAGELADQCRAAVRYGVGLDHPWGLGLRQAPVRMAINCR